MNHRRGGPEKQDPRCRGPKPKAWGDAQVIVQDYKRKLQNRNLKPLKKPTITSLTSDLLRKLALFLGAKCTCLPILCGWSLAFYF